MINGRESAALNHYDMDWLVVARVRTGDYRVQFRAEGESIIVEKIGHRDGFYED